MALTLQIISKPDSILLDNDIKKFVEEGGSIGRAEHCDLCLIDESQHISKIHALIHFRDNMYFITDVSTNGVFVNSDTVPIGKGNTKQILEGEKLRMGDYIIQATLLDGLPQKQVNELRVSNDDDIDALLNDSDDISDLLDVEVNHLQESNKPVINNQEASVDDILAGFSKPQEDVLATIPSDTENEAAIADLLGLDEIDAPSIDVMANTHKDNDALWHNVMVQLDVYQIANPEDEAAITRLKDFLQANKDQIIGSN